MANTTTLTTMSDLFRQIYGENVPALRGVRLDTGWVWVHEEVKDKLKGVENKNGWGELSY